MENLEGKELEAKLMVGICGDIECLKKLGIPISQETLEEYMKDSDLRNKGIG